MNNLPRFYRIFNVIVLLIFFLPASSEKPAKDIPISPQPKSDQNQLSLAYNIPSPNLNSTVKEGNLSSYGEEIQTAGTSQKIAVGYGHTCAITQVGGVKCWGWNKYGQLGDSTNLTRLTPVDVLGLSSGVTAITTGAYHTCVLTQAGGVKCWGNNGNGQLGDGTTTERWTLGDVSGLSRGVVAIAGGEAHTCVITQTGGVKCWGLNYLGQLGDGTTINRLTPVDVSGLSSGVTAITAGLDHTCALTQSGGVKCWGDNTSGDLGDGTPIERLAPIQVSGLSTGVAAIAGGGSHTCALTLAGGVKCWGYNLYGQLGDGTTTDHWTPVNVTGLSSGITAITAGWVHTCALTLAGGVKCWGNNLYGQLGDGTTTDHWTPLNVTGLSSGITAETAGWTQSCALTRAGGVKCWGNNHFGELGDGSTTDRWTPVDVMGLKGWISGPTLSANPAAIPANGSTYSIITLNNAPSGHLIRLYSSLGSLDKFTNGIGTVNSNGQFAARVASNSKGTAFIYAQDLTTGKNLPASTTVIFTPVDGSKPPPPPNQGDIAITGVSPKFPLDGRYLQGISVNDNIVVSVDWRGSNPGRVDFILNGVTRSEPANAAGANHTFDMGNDLGAWQNSLRIIAYNQAGQASQPVDFAPISAPAPVWLIGLQQIGAIAPMILGGSWQSGLEYSGAFKIPPDQIDLGAPGFGPAGSDTKLGFSIGGGLNLPLTCSSPIEMNAEAGASLNIDLVGVELGGELNGSGGLRAETQNCQIQTPEGVVQVEFKVYGQRDWPVLVFVADFIAPGAGEVLQSALPHDALKILGEVYLQGNWSGEYSSNALILPASPYLQWEDVSVSSGPGIGTGYQFNELGVSLKLYLGASGQATFSSPQPLTKLSDLSFDHVSLIGEAGLTLQLAWWEQEGKYSVEWRYPPGQLMSTPIKTSITPGWHLMPHPLREGYATLQTKPDGKQAFALQSARINGPGLSSSSTITSVLVSNVYTYSEPSLAINLANNNALMLWTHDDAIKPVGQSQEIEFSRWDGSAWSTPAGVTNDTLLDGTPQIVWDASGNGVAVWERLNEVLPITATWDITTAQKIEIATSTYNSSNNTWAPVTLLTDNKALDMNPQLARNSSGDLLSVWRQNTSGLLSGNEAHPDQVLAAFYNGNWGTPTPVVVNIPGIVDLASGYGNNAATIAYTRYLTPTGSITPTLQLFSSSWNGSSWSLPVQRTDDSLGNRTPQVVYNAANQPLIMWLAGSELRLKNLATSGTAALTLPVEIGSIDEFRLVQDASGNLAAVFTAQAANRDLYLAFYDAVHGFWSNPRRLTNDNASESYPAPAMDMSGRLLMGYETTQVQSITHTTTISGTTQIVTFTVPTYGQSDLMTLSHTFFRDLAIGQGDLAVSNSHPTPGETVVISATVHNDGDLALGGVSVGFYKGNPTSGGILIGTASLAQPLAAGFSAVLMETYTIPTAGGSQALYAVVDPSNTIPEADETNNTTSLAAFGPDLEIAGAAVDYWGGSDVGLQALVHNIGTTSSPTTTLAFYQGSITGTLLITNTLPALDAGQAITMTVPWNFGSLATGSYPVLAIANRNGFTETFKANNQYPFTLDVLPDLMISPYYLWTTPLTEHNVTITTTVYNIGAVAATNVTVGFYKDGSLDDSDLVISRTIPLLGQASSTQLIVQIPGPLTCGLTVWVDPKQLIVETTHANNLASVDTTGYFCLNKSIYLPVIQR